MSKSTRLTIPATLKTSLCEYVQSSEHKQHITGKQIQEWAYKQFGYVLPQSTISTVLGARGISIKRDGGRGRPPIRNKNLTNPNNSISHNNNNKTSINRNSSSNSNSSDSSNLRNDSSNSTSNSTSSTRKVSKRSTTNSKKGSASKSTIVDISPLTSSSTSGNSTDTTSPFYQQELILLDAILYFLQTSMLQITSGFVNSLISTYCLDLPLLRSKYFLITTLYQYFDNPYNYKDLILKLASKYPVLLSAPSIMHKDNSQSQNFGNITNSAVPDLTNLSDPVTSCKQNDFQLDSSLINNQLIEYWPDTSFGIQPQFYNPLQTVPPLSSSVSQMQPIQSNNNAQNVETFSNLQNLQQPSYTGIPLEQQQKPYLHLQPTPPPTNFQENNGTNNNGLLLQTPIHGSSNLLNSLDSNRNIM